MIQLFSNIFSAFGLSASAGLNAYIPLLIISISAKISTLTGWDFFTLQEPWDTMESWWVIGLLLVLSVIEFFADKIPAVNHANDVIQTFIRPTAGAIAFAASANMITDVSPVLSLVLGLFISGGVHTAKAAVLRPAVSATTAGAGTPVVSFLEDVAATFLSIVAILLPLLIAIVLFFFLFWLFVRIYRRANRPPTGAA